MRFATRAFLWSLVPFAVLLVVSFWTVQNRVLLRVREGLQTSVKQTQASLASMLARTEQRDRSVLRAVSQNPVLKDGMQLILGDRGDPATQRTVEDQLLEIGGELGFDFLLVSDSAGAPLAAVMRQEGGLTALDLSQQPPPRQGYFTRAGRTYQVTSVPIDQGTENLGALSVGERLDLSAVPGVAVLMHNGRIIESNTRGLPLVEAETGFEHCSENSECEIRLGKETFVSTPLQSRSEQGDGYVVRSLESVDAATGPIQATLHSVFLLVGLGALAAAVCVSGFCSRSIVRPISGVIEKLRESAKTGELPRFEAGKERIHEIRDLTESFNRAAAAIRDGQERLQAANVEFIESLASALDARDPYTAGHSRRVSQYACAVAQTMGLSPAEAQEVRIGALLHDIGKIGIADAILQKPERLTAEEDRLIRQHPSIGRRILEGVHGFQPFLNVVELHHENWDGSGYPRGLRGEDTPLTARVVKIADAWDAMTSDRPYRQGMSRNQALAALRRASGTQMDPAITAVFCNLWESKWPEAVPAAATQGADSSLAHSSLARLSDAVGVSTPLAQPSDEGQTAARKEA